MALKFELGDKVGRFIPLSLRFGAVTKILFFSAGVQLPVVELLPDVGGPGVPGGKEDAGLWFPALPDGATPQIACDGVFLFFLFPYQRDSPFLPLHGSPPVSFSANPAAFEVLCFSFTAKFWTKPSLELLIDPLIFKQEELAHFLAFLSPFLRSPQCQRGLPGFVQMGALSRWGHLSPFLCSPQCQRGLPGFVHMGAPALALGFQSSCWMVGSPGCHRWTCSLAQSHSWAASCWLIGQTSCGSATRMAGM